MDVALVKLLHRADNNVIEMEYQFNVVKPSTDSIIALGNAYNGKMELIKTIKTVNDLYALPGHKIYQSKMNSNADKP